MAQAEPESILVLTGAGGINLVHIHGEPLKARCLACGHVEPWAEELSPGSVCRICAIPGRLRVDVVWLGKILQNGW